jgi:dihydrofolate reductase
MPVTRTYVFSRSVSPAALRAVTVLTDDSKLAQLREGKGKDIWRFGGDVFSGSRLSAGLADRIEL